MVTHQTNSIAENKSKYKIRFEKEFVPQDFKQSLNMFVMIIKQSEHGLGFRYIVKECLRMQDGCLFNIIYQYKMLSNGDLSIHSHEQFGGRISLEEM